MVAVVPVNRLADRDLKEARAVHSKINEGLTAWNTCVIDVTCYARRHTPRVLRSVWKVCRKAW